MINFLKAGRYNAFNITNRYECNRQGGVALWDLPDVFRAAFNPILFTRTRYYFVTDGYTPTRSPRPNPVSIKPDPSNNNNPRIVQLTYPADQYLIVQLTTPRGTRTVEFQKGEKTKTASSNILSIDGFRTTAGTTVPAEPVLTTAEYIYMAVGETFENENYIVDEKGSILYVVDDVDTSYLDVYKATGEVGAKLSGESFRGVTTFDVAAVVRLWFDEQLADSAPDAPQPGGPYSDGRLFARYAVKGIGGVGTSYDFMAVNAVAQVGEHSDLGAYRGQLLSEFRTLYLYDGYPLDYSTLDDNVIRYSKGVVRTPIDEDHIPDPDNAPFTVVRACTPAQPFYIRWINRLGGVDYYMFRRIQRYKPEVKSANTYQTYVPDPYEAATNRRAWAIATENTVTVGADNVPEAEYAPLSKLPFAPTIEWYDGRRWVELSVSKFDGSHDTNSRTHDIEITFTLPKINVQF